MKKRTLILYGLAAVAVVVLGALAGWYFFLRSQTGATQALGAERGFNAQIPAGNGGIGGTDAGGAPGASDATGTSTATKNIAPPQLWHVAEAPAAGVGFATSTTGSRLRYAERATGYIFEADPSNGGIVRLTNSLMPKTYEAYFAAGNRVIERSVDASGAVTTFAGLIDAQATSTALSGTSLVPGILEVAPDPKNSQLFFLQPQGSGVAGMVSQWNGSKQSRVFSSALPDWNVWWLQDGRMILAQKAADSLAGYAYTLKGGVLNPLLGPLPGLGILPRTGSSALLYSTSSGGRIALFAQTSATTSASRLAVVTLADKCAWAPGQELIAYCAVPQSTPVKGFLDEWYRGEIHSSDALWRIDAGTGQAELMFTPATNVSLDVINPVVDDAGAYIAFINAADGSPWLLRLNK